MTERNGTPRQFVSNFDHLVTQWMSTVIAVVGRAMRSSHDNVRSASTAPEIRKSHSAMS
jgi:hypothetical protein